RTTLSSCDIQAECRLSSRVLDCCHVANPKSSQDVPAAVYRHLGADAAARPVVATAAVCLGPGRVALAGRRAVRRGRPAPGPAAVTTPARTARAPLFRLLGPADQAEGPGDQRCRTLRSAVRKLDRKAAGTRVR